MDPIEKRPSNQPIVIRNPVWEDGNRRGLRWPRPGTIVFLVLFSLYLVVVVLPKVSRLRASSKTTKSMKRIYLLGKALRLYHADFSGYPKAAAETDQSLDGLIPGYLKQPLWNDGWGRPLIYRTSGDKGGLAESYTLSSAGYDGVSQGYQRATTFYFECDIVYQDGMFIQSPAGVSMGPQPLHHFMNHWMPDY